MSATRAGGYVDPPPLAFAHRGGLELPGNAGIENTVKGIGNAVALGYRYIETDVRASSDGVPFAFHDTDLRRVAPESEFAQAQFGSLTAAQIRTVRLAGEPIPTVAELLAAFPTTRFNMDVKTNAAIGPTIQAIVEADARDRVLIASFSGRRLRSVRRLLPGVVTSAGPVEVIGLAIGWGPLRRLAARRGAVAVQVPEFYRGFRLVSGRFLANAHKEGLQVHIWTVDDSEEIDRLLDLGVDGVITDRPDVLKDVLIRRGQWGTGRGSADLAAEV